jgi:hypothetical protein
MPGVLKHAAYGDVSGWPGLITHWPAGRILLAARGLAAVLAQGRPGGVVVGISASPQLVKVSRCGSGLVVPSSLSGPIEDLPRPWRLEGRCPATTATLTRYGARSAAGRGDFARRCAGSLCWLAAGSPR